MNGIEFELGVMCLILYRNVPMELLSLRNFAQDFWSNNTKYAIGKKYGLDVMRWRSRICMRPWQKTAALLHLLLLSQSLNGCWHQSLFNNQPGESPAKNAWRLVVGCRAAVEVGEGESGIGDSTGFILTHRPDNAGTSPIVQEYWWHACVQAVRPSVRPPPRHLAMKGWQLNLPGL